jgi:squalene-associated FAD-dependent desaturase
LKAPPRIAVIGAGWAGLSAATELATKGAKVTVFEAAPQTGGRARSLVWPGASGVGGSSAPRIDNGQHLLVGAYGETLALLKRLGGDEQQLFHRQPFNLISDQGFELKASNVPAPWHLVRALLFAKGLSWADRWSIAVLGWALERAGWKTAVGLAVAQLLNNTRQTTEVRRRVWNPLCLAALNTPPERACAATFAAVLRDTLGADARASDLLVPAVPLGDTLPKLAEVFLARHGATLRLRHLVRSLAQDHARPVVDGEAFDGAIVALAPHSARRLLGSRIPVFPTESIQTLWVLLAPGTLAHQQLRLLETGPGEWLFTRREANGLTLASMVISAAGRGTDREQLVRACLDQLDQLLRRGGQLSGLDPIRVLGTQLIEEKFATFSCGPARPRPDVDAYTEVSPNVMIAGDWTASEYPATLESAVRSVLRAARFLSERVWTAA